MPSNWLYRLLWCGCAVLALACAGGSSRKSAAPVRPAPPAAPVQAAPQRPAPAPIRLHLDAAGRLQLNGAPVALPQLDARLRRLRQQHPQASHVVITAPWEAQRPLIAQVLPIARRYGLLDLTIGGENE